MDLFIVVGSSATSDSIYVETFTELDDAKWLLENDMGDDKSVLITVKVDIEHHE